MLWRFVREIQKTNSMQLQWFDVFIKTSQFLIPFQLAFFQNDLWNSVQTRPYSHFFAGCCSAASQLQIKFEVCVWTTLARFHRNWNKVITECRFPHFPLRTVAQSEKERVAVVADLCGSIFSCFNGTNFIASNDARCIRNPL